MPLTAAYKPPPPPVIHVGSSSRKQKTIWYLISRVFNFVFFAIAQKIMKIKTHENKSAQNSRTRN